MDFKEIVADLNLRPVDLARELGVSDGHVGDLLSKRRRMSLKIAAGLERLTGKPVVAAVVAERTKAA